MIKRLHAASARSYAEALTDHEHQAWVAADIVVERAYGFVCLVCELHVTIPRNVILDTRNNAFARILYDRYRTMASREGLLGCLRAAVEATRPPPDVPPSRDLYSRLLDDDAL
jgi:hypothetical protein